MFGEKTVNLGLWDTAGKIQKLRVTDFNLGQEDYDKLRYFFLCENIDPTKRPLSYPDTNVFIICFSLVDPQSFRNVTEKWLVELRNHCPNVPIVLCGTKLDLREDPDKQENSISKEQGMNLKEKEKLYAYVECSAKKQKGLQEVFNAAMEAALCPNLPKTECKQKKKKKCTIL